MALRQDEPSGPSNVPEDRQGGDKTEEREGPPTGEILDEFKEKLAELGTKLLRYFESGEIGADLIGIPGKIYAQLASWYELYGPSVGKFFVELANGTIDYLDKKKDDALDVVGLLPDFPDDTEPSTYDKYFGRDPSILDVVKGSPEANFWRAFEELKNHYIKELKKHKPLKQLEHNLKQLEKEKSKLIDDELKRKRDLKSLKKKKIAPMGYGGTSIYKETAERAEEREKKIKELEETPVNLDPEEGDIPLSQGIQYLEKEIRVVEGLIDQRDRAAFWEERAKQKGKDFELNE